MNKYFTSVLLILIIIIKIDLNAQNIDLVKLISYCKPAVFSIYTYDENNNFLSCGTGFFIDSLGTALSCYHVLEGASSAFIKTSDYRQYNICNIISQNKDLDIIKFSVQKEKFESFKYLKTNKSTIKEGEPIFVIGNPLGLENSVSEGIVSSIRDFTEFGRIIQTTAPISSGNSGSPLLDKEGKVIGIIRFTISKGQNLNFAINIQESNLLTPVGRLVFPHREYFDINTFQRANWCSTKEDIRNIEQSSILDNSALSEALNIDIRKKVPTASILVYRNVFLNNIKVDIEYIFDSNCLSNIRITSSNYYQQEYRSMNSLLEEFIHLVEYFCSNFDNVKIFLLLGSDKLQIEKEVFVKENINKLTNILTERGGCYSMTFDDFVHKSNYLILITGKEMQLWTMDIKPL